MYNNDYMYAIERSDEYLAHYGIRGMKWGVRKAREMGGAKGAKRLSKQYAKASKKLAKLEKRAANSGKYARRAALMGAGAAAAGGLAAAGTGGVARGISAIGSAGMKASKGIGKGLVGAAKLGSRIPGANKVAGKVMGVGYNMQALGQNGSRMHKGIAGAANSVAKWGRGTSISGAATKHLDDIMTRAGKAATRGGNISALERRAHATVAGASKGASGALKGVSNNTIARIGAGVVGAGLAAGAAKNAYRASTAQKKAARFKSEMNKAFAGTQYANKPRQGKKRRK